MVISKLKAFLYSIYMVSVTYYRGYLRWKAVSNIEEGVLVYYGHDQIPNQGEHASGGIVKCQDLCKIYPNTLQGANILYLVSSALPPFPEILVKMAKKRGVKLVVNQNGVAIPAYHGSNLEVINKPRRFLLEQADHVIYQSMHCKVSADIFLTTEVPSWSILMNPVDVKQFSAKECSFISSEPVLLLAGSHAHFHRVKAAIDVVHALKKQNVAVRLKIIGRFVWESSREQCLQEVQRYCELLRVSDFVDFGREYTQNEAAALYQSADILLHTKYNDPCPRVVVEAMASGLPVVYSDSGGVGELVGSDAGIGISVPKGWDTIQLPDPDEMAEGVLTILNEYQRYSMEARKRVVKHLDVVGWLQSHKELFEKLQNTTQ